ncbi:hypothetical protein TNCV_4012941 [Trichonephila clavipes]|nr:hypothetical protein TNCV_4012941 [Trichonephila clavipes]
MRPWGTIERNHLHKTCPQRWIKRSGPIPRPVKLPDITSLHIFLGNRQRQRYKENGFDSFDQQLVTPKHPTHFQSGLDLENALAIRDVENPRCLDNPEQRVFDDMLRCRP